VGLFFDGDHGAGALVLAWAKAESGTRWELDRGRRTEDRGQRTEDRGQRSEVRGQRSEIRDQSIAQSRRPGD
jgi:hypothetical protein